MQPTAFTPAVPSFQASSSSPPSVVRKSAAFSVDAAPAAHRQNPTPTSDSQQSSSNNNLFDNTVMSTSSTSAGAQVERGTQCGDSLSSGSLDGSVHSERSVNSAGEVGAHAEFEFFAGTNANAPAASAATATGSSSSSGATSNSSWPKSNAVAAAAAVCSSAASGSESELTQLGQCFPMDANPTNAMQLLQMQVQLQLQLQARHFRPFDTEKLLKPLSDISELSEPDSQSRSSAVGAGAKARPAITAAAAANANPSAGHNRDSQSLSSTYERISSGSGGQTPNSPPQQSQAQIAYQCPGHPLLAGVALDALSAEHLSLECLMQNLSNLSSHSPNLSETAIEAVELEMEMGVPPAPDSGLVFPPGAVPDTVFQSLSQTQTAAARAAPVQPPAGLVAPTGTASTGGAAALRATGQAPAPGGAALMSSSLPNATAGAGAGAAGSAAEDTEEAERERAEIAMAAQRRIFLADWLSKIPEPVLTNTELILISCFYVLYVSYMYCNCTRM